MSSGEGAEARGQGGYFDEIAGDYDRHRPAYPDALVDRACELAGAGPGDPILEIGCGTGQLTRSLVARGLRVTAVDPGGDLIARARARVPGAGDVRFVQAHLEDASLPAGGYRAVFSASAIHWVDPDLGWHRIAEALADGGTLALISFFGLEDPRSARDQAAMRAALARVAPEVASAWPAYRDLEGMLAGVADRRSNVSEAWSWLGGYDLGRGYAAALFQDVRLATEPLLREDTAEELRGLLTTMTFWARLSPRQRDALAAECHALERRLGRPIRSSTVACLLTARRAPRRGTRGGEGPSPRSASRAGP